MCGEVVEIVADEGQIDDINAGMNEAYKDVNATYNLKILNVFIDYYFLYIINGIFSFFWFYFFNVGLYEAPKECHLHRQSHGIQYPNGIFTHMLLNSSSLSHSSSTILVMAVCLDDVTLNARY